MKSKYSQDKLLKDSIDALKELHSYIQKDVERIVDGISPSSYYESWYDKEGLHVRVANTVTEKQICLLKLKLGLNNVRQIFDEDLGESSIILEELH